MREIVLLRPVPSRKHNKAATIAEHINSHATVAAIDGHLLEEKDVYYTAVLVTADGPLDLHSSL